MFSPLRAAQAPSSHTSWGPYRGWQCQPGQYLSALWPWEILTLSLCNYQRIAFVCVCANKLELLQCGRRVKKLAQRSTEWENYFILFYFFALRPFESYDGCGLSSDPWEDIWGWHSIAPVTWPNSQKQEKFSPVEKDSNLTESNWSPAPNFNAQLLQRISISHRGWGRV